MDKAIEGPRWSSWQVVLKDGQGARSYPVSEAMEAGGDGLETPLGKMKLLEMLGFPGAKQSLDLEKADTKSPVIWILKCKPSCWRLYLHIYSVSDTDKRFVYLHAKCKKKSKQSPTDTARARRNLAAASRVESGGIERFSFPTA